MDRLCSLLHSPSKHYTLINLQLFMPLYKRQIVQSQEIITIYHYASNGNLSSQKYIITQFVSEIFDSCTTAKYSSYVDVCRMNDAAI